MLSVRVERVPGSHGTNPFSYPLEASAIHQVVRLDIFGSPARSKESLWQKGQDLELRKTGTCHWSGPGRGFHGNNGAGVCRLEGYRHCFPFSENGGKISGQ